MQQIKQLTKKTNLGRKTRSRPRVKSRARISRNPDRFLALKDYLQRKYGNYQVGRMAESGYLQAQLKISNPGDVYEREADATADKVMSMPEQDVNRQAVPEDEKETANRQADKEEEKTVNKQPTDDKEELKAKLILRQAPGEKEETVSKQPTEDKEELAGKFIQQQEKKEEEDNTIKKQPGQDKEEDKTLNTKPENKCSPVIRPSLTSVIKKASSGGEPLPKQTRGFFEKRFGTGFEQVRVHHDQKAEDSARIINARAYTLGRHIVFGKGEYSPSSPQGQKLLAHELTHVVQQQGNAGHIIQEPRLNRHHAQIQRKLKLTGSEADVARVVAIINKGLSPLYVAKVSGSGEITIAASGKKGSLSSMNQFFESKFRQLVNESGTTTVSVVTGGVPIVGSYALSQIDIADIESLGIGEMGWDARAALLHELVEQREKQLAKTPEEQGYEKAHEKGLAAELGMIGATLESDSGLVGASTNTDGTMNGTRSVVFKYPDGKRYQVDVTISHNNITGVKRKKLT